MMDRRVTRQVASVLLVIAVILFGIKSLDPKSEAAAPPKEGYVEVKQEDYSRLEQDAKEWKQKYEDLKKEKAAKPDNSVVKVMHLNINDGMTSKEVGRQMEKAEIIEDANEFNDYLAKKKWQQSIQIGDYELTSEMGLQEIAETITGNLPEKE
ncbi:endolytic transglycosylase MltG [Siminovitchia fortis]|uniref:Uncharacterized protein n=2 Tax=Siminovitchia fortis TaxID=254758 RepID=A0A443J3S4_9BACI|nr:endolytic transglycosylase MltG [Siminovitchia fortis]RWR15122.1 hypothetical protein D4N35_000860 [Siminovitchia fortis]WHY82738.1 endolytic transglycosylase MltG [Siminovitchia fortis]